MTSRSCLAAGVLSLAVLSLTALAVSCEKSTTGAPDGRELTLYQPGDQTVKKGEPNQVKVTIDRKNFRDAVKVSFDRLPEGVVTTDKDKSIPPEENSATFTLKAESQAPVVTNHRVEVVARAPAGLESRQAFNLTIKE